MFSINEIKSMNFTIKYVSEISIKFKNINIFFFLKLQKTF